jgi:hypothetical protein
MRTTLSSMNPIALVETTTATRRAVLGALATDPGRPSPDGRYRCVSPHVAAGLARPPLPPGCPTVSISWPLIRRS